MARSPTVGVWVFCIGSLVVIVGTEVFYRQPLFDKSLTFIPTLQSGATDGTISFWHTYSDVGLALAPALSIGIPYFIPE